MITVKRKCTVQDEQLVRSDSRRTIAKTRQNKAKCTPKLGMKNNIMPTLQCSIFADTIQAAKLQCADLNSLC